MKYNIISKLNVKLKFNFDIKRNKVNFLFEFIYLFKIYVVFEFYTNPPLSLRLSNIIPTFSLFILMGISSLIFLYSIHFNYFPFRFAFKLFPS